jgi:hypothetical protein
MTETYRLREAVRAPKERPPSARFGGRCVACGTEQAVEVVAGAEIVLQVTGKGCEECNPGPGNNSSGERRSTIRVWWDAPNGQAPGWVAAGLPGEAPAGPAPVPAPAPAGRQAATDQAWLEVAGSVPSCFEPAEWPAVAAAWRPEYCAVFGSVGALVRRFWAAVRGAAGGQLMIRMAGVPALVAALLPELLARSFASESGQYSHELDVLLRKLGVLLCAGTGQASTCGSLHEELGRAPSALDRRLLERPDYRRVLGKIDGGPTLTSVAGLLGQPVAVSGPPGPPPPRREAPPEPANVIEVAIGNLRPIEPPPAPVVFGA